LLTGSDGFNGSPVVSPDGRSVEFISDPGTLERCFSGLRLQRCPVYVMQLGGGGVRRSCDPGVPA